MRRHIDLAALRRDDLLLDRLGRGGFGPSDDEVAMLLGEWRTSIVVAADPPAPALPERSLRSVRPAIVGAILVGALVSAGGAAAASVGAEHGAMFGSVSQVRATQPARVRLAAAPMGRRPTGLPASRSATGPIERTLPAPQPVAEALDPVSVRAATQPRASRAQRPAVPPSVGHPLGHRLHARPTPPPRHRPPPVVPRRHRPPRDWSPPSALLDASLGPQVPRALDAVARHPRPSAWAGRRHVRWLPPARWSVPVRITDRLWWAYDSRLPEFPATVRRR